MDVGDGFFATEVLPMPMSPLNMALLTGTSLPSENGLHNTAGTSASPLLAHHFQACVMHASAPQSSQVTKPHLALFD